MDEAGKVVVMTLLLNGLSEDQQRELLAAGSPRSLKPRDVLGAQGEPAESIALVQIGHLKLGQVNADGAETLVRFIGAWGVAAEHSSAALFVRDRLSHLAIDTLV